jgi:hypothetical protein
MEMKNPRITISHRNLAITGITRKVMATIMATPISPSIMVLMTLADNFCSLQLGG